MLHVTRKCGTDLWINARYIVSYQHAVGGGTELLLVNGYDYVVFEKPEMITEMLQEFGCKKDET